MKDRQQLQRDIRNAQERTRRANRRDAIAQQERRKRDALKRRMIEHRGSACTRCKRTLEDFGHPAAFDFHHRDPSEKRFNVCGNYTRSWAVLEAELQKCDLICACCHRIIEAIAVDDEAGLTVDSMPAAGLRGGRPPRSAEQAIENEEDERARDAIRAATLYTERREAERRAREAMRRDQIPLFELQTGDDACCDAERAA
jgi:hypothetical protein